MKISVMTMGIPQHWLPFKKHAFHTIPKILNIFNYANVLPTQQFSEPLAI